MPTALPAPAPIAPRRRPYGLARTALMLAALLLGRLLFSAAMACARLADRVIGA